MPGESYRRRLTSLLLCLCDVFRALINSVKIKCSADTSSDIISDLGEDIKKRRKKGGKRERERGGVGVGVGANPSNLRRVPAGAFTCGDVVINLHFGQ